jgi:hypothetical protein
MKKYEFSKGKLDKFANGERHAPSQGNAVLRDFGLDLIQELLNGCHWKRSVFSNHLNRETILQQIPCRL